MKRSRTELLFAVVLFAVPFLTSTSAEAQEPASDDLAVLIARARAENVEIAAARRLADAAAARVPQAGALDDPLLAAGIMSVPINTLSLRRDEMTMGTVQLSQRLPAFGARRLRSAVARHEHLGTTAEAEEVELDVMARLKDAYYDAVFLDASLAVLGRNRALLVDFAEVARGRFSVGRAPQQDVLRAQTEITRLDEQVASVQARRSAAVARVNVLVQRSPLFDFVPRVPRSVHALATARPSRALFTAAALDGGMGADFPALPDLQRRAVAQRPMLRAHEHRIEALRASTRLAERERLPELELMLGYGIRWEHPDVVSAGVSVPLPLFAGRKQRQVVLERGHELAAQELTHHRMALEIEGEVATHYAALVRIREQILLLGDGVIPQARAAIESSAAAYRTGQVDFLSLLDAQAALFRNEIELARQLSDFGRELAALERAAGLELMDLEAP